MHPHWIIPDWPAPPGVRAVFTTRHGGVSTAPFDSLNLGEHVGDAPERVAANRALLAEALNAKAVFLQQVHGTQVAQLHANTADRFVADACLTSERQLACTIMVADCLPVLLATRCGTWVGAAHAGWRGLAGVRDVPGVVAADDVPDQPKTPKNGKLGVLEAIFESFQVHALANTAWVATDLIAWLGPCIGPAAFEVGAEVKAAFEASQPGAARCFKPAGPGKFMADLPALARGRLQALGLGDAHIYGNDSSPSWCTHSNPSRFFSHRRDAGSIWGNGFNTTGRMAVCIWKA